MIKHGRIRVHLSQVQDGTLRRAIVAASGSPVLKWFISDVDGDEVIVDVTLWLGSALPTIGAVHVPRCYSVGRVVAHIVPTGIGCDIGGYAGDAGPANRLLASACDWLVTNPNTVNASNYINISDNTLFVEGSFLDSFCAGDIILSPPRHNRLGLIVDRADHLTRDMALNIVNAMRAIHGIDVIQPILTDVPIGARYFKSESGAVTGTLGDPEPLLNACSHLIAAGATAIAVASVIEDLPAEDYAKHFSGIGPNPVGGAEAVISHLISRRFGIPAAHAPLLNWMSNKLNGGIVDPRSAGEYVSSSGLACILLGLAKAPQIGGREKIGMRAHVPPEDLLAVVCPESAFGGAAVLSATARGIPIITISENTTLLSITAERLGLKGVHNVSSYAEAAGLLLALGEGISFESIRRPLKAVEAQSFP